MASRSHAANQKSSPFGGLTITHKYGKANSYVGLDYGGYRLGLFVTVSILSGSRLAW